MLQKSRALAYLSGIAGLLATTFAVSVSANAGDRLALLIGNSRYEHATPLRNPENDVDLLETSLRKVKFRSFVGQNCALRFIAFSQRTTPEIFGRVTRIGADLTRQSQTGQAFFVARISVEADELKKLKDIKLVPGMPVEVFVQTGQRTALSYLMKPFSDQLARAFRED